MEVKLFMRMGKGERLEESFEVHLSELSATDIQHAVRLLLQDVQSRGAWAARDRSPEERAEAGFAAVRAFLSAKG